jgi:large subunit ribosomal protein L30
MSEKKIKIRLIKSTIGTPKKIKNVVYALGLKRPNSEVIHNASPTILGMVKKTNHMVQVFEI